MQQPTRLISTPFAQEGEKTEIQNVTGEFDNSATYRLGFPPLTMQSIRLGGKPPKGTDFNGVLFDITENISFLCKGGRYQYNAGLSTLIGGYPEGSNLLLDDNVTEVVSTVAGNQNNPNTNMTGWILKPNKTTAVNVADASGETQQQVNYNGGAKWHSRVGGYLENERVVLANGNIVKSTIDGNVNNPNVDMTGWELADAALNAQKLKRENVSVWDFFTAQEVLAYKASPTSFDALRPIQEFFTYIALNDVGTAYCSITAGISQGIKMGNAGAHATRVVSGNMQLQALNAIDTMVEREIGQDFEWVGLIYLIGHRTATSPTYVWRNRTCRIGMSTHATYENARQKWGGFRFLYFQQNGLQIMGKNTAGHYKYVRGNGNGVGLSSDARYRFETTFNSRVDTGTSSSASQRSTIKVVELPPSVILNDTNCYVIINNESYCIESHNVAESTITVLPWVDLEQQSGTLAYCFGGLVSVKGGDSSAVSFDVIEGTNNGINLNDTSLYTANVGLLMSQACGFGYNLGGQVGSANLGGVVNSYYAEGNHLDILMTSTAVATKVITNCYTVQLSKVKTISFRSSSNVLITRNISALRLGFGGKILTGIKQPDNAAGITELNLFTKNIDGQIFRNNAQIFTLPDVDADVNRLTGIDSMSVKVVGQSASAIPTSVTFRKLAGATINGSSSDVVFSGFTAPPVFDIYALISTNNYVIVCREVQKGVATATYDPPSIVANSSVTTEVALSGATVGSVVQAAFSQYNAGVEINAVVSSANTVTVKFKNTTAAPIDLPSGTLTVKLI